MLLYYITDHRRIPGGFRKFVKVPKRYVKNVHIHHSLTGKIDPEITEPTTWFVGIFIPFKLFERFTGATGEPAGQKWQGNFYKCGDKTSHPHWASWSPVYKHNFHLPQYFGTLIFGKEKQVRKR